MARRVIAKVSACGRYEQVESAKDSERAGFARMLAEQSPPQINGTDSLWFRRKGTSDPFGAMPQFIREEMHRRARRQGISLTGKEYNPSLVRKEYADRGMLDPEAVIDSVSDVRRVLASRPHASSDGMVDQVGREYENPPDFTFRANDEMIEDAVVDECLDQGIDRMSVREFNEKKNTLRQEIEGDMNE